MQTLIKSDLKSVAQTLKLGQATVFNGEILECVPIAKDRLGLGLEERGFRVQAIDPTFELTQYSIPVDYPVIVLDPENKTEYEQGISDIKAAKILVIDSETFGEKVNKGLHPWNSAIRLVQVFDGRTVYVIDLGGRSFNTLPLFADFSAPNEEGKKRHSKFIEVLKEVCKRIPVIAHNAHYDCLRLRIHLGISIEKPVCTFIGARVYFGDYGKSEESQQKYDPVLKGGYSLKNLCKRFFDLNIDKGLQMSDWGLPHLSKAQIEYASLDVIYGWHVFHYLNKLYADTTKPLYCPQIKKIWAIENRMIPVTVQMELNGLPFDGRLCQQQINQLTELKDLLLIEWQELSPLFSHNQNAQLLRHINNKYNLTLVDLDKSSLAEYSELPEIKLRLQIKALEALLNNLLAFQRSANRDGRVHTVFRTLTGFGRLSSGDSKNGDDMPNMQAIVSKKNPRIAHLNPPNPREVIRCAPDKSYLIVDLAGAHGRIAADQADDAKAIAGNNDPNVDNHSKVAVYVLEALEEASDPIIVINGEKPKRQTVDWKDIQKAVKDKKNPLQAKANLGRDTAKNTYYGWLNGAGAQRIQNQIAANTGFRPPLEACQAAIKGCEILYPDVLSHRHNLHKRLKLCRVSIDGQWYVVNHTSDGGRLLLRMEVSKYTEDYEAPYTQSLAAIWSRIEATAIKEAAIEIHWNTDPKWNLKMCAIVHDEIDFEVDQAFSFEAATYVNQVIGDCFARYLAKVHDGRETDANKLICRSWADK